MMSTCVSPFLHLPIPIPTILDLTLKFVHVAKLCMIGPPPHPLTIVALTYILCVIGLPCFCHNTVCTNQTCQHSGCGTKKIIPAQNILYVPHYLQEYHALIIKLDSVWLCSLYFVELSPVPSSTSFANSINFSMYNVHLCNHLLQVMRLFFWKTWDCSMY